MFLEIRWSGLINVMNFRLEEPIAMYMVVAQVRTKVADSLLREHAVGPTACPSLPRKWGQVSGTTVRPDSATC